MIVTEDISSSGVSLLTNQLSALSALFIREAAARGHGGLVTAVRPSYRETAATAYRNFMRIYYLLAKKTLFKKLFPDVTHQQQRGSIFSGEASSQRCGNISQKTHRQLKLSSNITVVSVCGRQGGFVLQQESTPYLRESVCTSRCRNALGGRSPQTL